MNKKPVFAIFLATGWIGLSEFVRNELLFKSYWVHHYQSMGIVFPSQPVNNAVWAIWSLLLAIVIYILGQKYTLVHTFLLSWFVGFVLMWVVIGNMGVLPFGILVWAIPWSLLEVFVAAFMIKKMS
ncbi:hypothetical protein GF406_07310 [candidate division KSB1 bacterium]|nr:hypothetical protein [candidate division KSB1 bacterium]